MSSYQRKYVFAQDFGTSHSKFGTISCGENPRIIETRGYLPHQTTAMQKIAGKSREVIVGSEVPCYLESNKTVSDRLVYPMRHGHIDKNDVPSWSVIEELVRFAVDSFIPQMHDFEGFDVVASLSATSPKFMYEKLFEIFGHMSTEFGTVQAATIIPQPLAVVFSQDTTEGVVVESGEGNTQNCPVSQYPIQDAIVAINRGGGGANALTSEIMKDSGYDDLVHEESLVRKVKESLGLVPAELDAAIHIAQSDPERFRAVYTVPGTKVCIDLGENSSMRFLIGEYVFNPNNEVFNSYFTRGMARPDNVKIGDNVFEGMLDLGDAIVKSVELCPSELQSRLYSRVILSGGNFAWAVPAGMEGVAVDSRTKICHLLEDKGIPNAMVTLVKNPQCAVWRGCIVYGCHVPTEFRGLGKTSRAG